MRRIDAIAITFAAFAAGGIVFLILQGVGFDSLSAGIWSQALLVGGLFGWILTYMIRAVTKNLSYHQQRREYEDSVLQKRLDAMSPEEVEKLLAEIEQEKQAKINQP